VTTFSNRAAILAELWMNYRNDIRDFIEYNDLGLPLSYLIAEGIVTPTDIAEKFVDETYNLFIEGLGIEDGDFQTLEELLSDGKVEE
jgi:hypothetical protein